MNELPLDFVAHVASFLDPVSLLCLGEACKAFHSRSAARRLEVLQLLGDFNENSGITIAMMISRSLLSSEPSAIASFAWDCRRTALVAPNAVARFLTDVATREAEPGTGVAASQNSSTTAILDAYLSLFDMRNDSVVQSLRRVLARCRLPPGGRGTRLLLRRLAAQHVVQQKQKRASPPNNSDSRSQEDDISSSEQPVHQSEPSLALSEDAVYVLCHSALVLNADMR